MEHCRFRSYVTFLLICEQNDESLTKNTLIILDFILNWILAFLTSKWKRYLELKDYFLVIQYARRMQWVAQSDPEIAVMMASSLYRTVRRPSFSMGRSIIFLEKWVFQLPKKWKNMRCHHLDHISLGVYVALDENRMKSTSISSIYIHIIATSLSVPHTAIMHSQTEGNSSLKITHTKIDFGQSNLLPLGMISRLRTNQQYDPYWICLIGGNFHIGSPQAWWRSQTNDHKRKW